MMKRVLVSGMTGNPGGIEAVVMNYYRQMDRSKIQFDFLVYCDHPAYEEEILNMGGRFYRVVARRENPFLHYVELSHFFHKYAKEFSVFWMNDCSLSHIGPIVYSKRYGIPVRVIHGHNAQNMGGRLSQILHLSNKKRIKKYATNFWSCSNLAGKFFYTDDIVNSSNYKVINNAMIVSDFVFTQTKRDKMRRALDIEDQFVVGHVGRFHWQKNHSFLVEIFMEIHNKEPNATLLLVGQGEDEQMIRARVTRLGLDDCVRFLGVRSDITDLMQAMDVLVMPSNFEGMPVVGIEAQASGLNCFFSDSITNEVGITELANFISLAQSPDEWANRILEKKNSARNNMCEDIRSANFDILVEAVKLQGFFEGEANS